MRIRRNDPCPCGSALPYFRCCRANSTPPADLLWHRLRKAYNSLVDRLLTFSQQRVGEPALAYAAAEFLVWPEEGELDEAIRDHMALFMPWFLFNWVYDPQDSEVELDYPPGLTVAQIYMAESEQAMEGLERRLTEASLHKPLSYLEVAGCEPGRGFELKDLFSGRQARITEKEGSRTVRSGDILLGRLVAVDHIAMLVGCSPVALPPAVKPKILNLRRQMKRRFGGIADEVLSEYDLEIRELFFDFYNRLMRPPRVANTDGDPLLLHTLRYRINDPQDAFEKLCTLAGESETPDSLQRIAILDGTGRVIHVEIPWLRNGPLESTFLGQLVIDHTSLVVKVDSSARAQSITAEIHRRLGRAARHLATETRPPE